MKKIIIKLVRRAVVFLAVFIAVICMVDFHSDGVLIRDANYYIRSANESLYQMEVYNSFEVFGTPVQLIKSSSSAGQTFEIKHVKDDEYAIMYGPYGMCIAVASDRETVVAQGYDENNDYNRWHIERIGNTQSYRLTNAATHTSLCYEYSDTLKSYQMLVKEETDSDKKYEFLISKN